MGQPTGSHFQPRARDKGDLSVTWVECESEGDSDEERDAVRQAFKAHIPTYDRQGKIAVLQVGQVRRVARKMPGGAELDVLHVALPSWPCHSVVHGIREPFELALAELLADLAAASGVWTAR